MNKTLIFLIGMAILMPGCALHNGLTFNTNSHTTEVVLAKKNFRVTEMVQGESSATYVFGFGGLSRKAMIAEARADMLTQANMVGSSKAIVNETVEVKHSFFPFVRKYKVTVSGHIVEFTE
jgi:hypothetical protein